MGDRGHAHGRTWKREPLLANSAEDSPRMVLTGVSGVGLADDVCGEGTDSRNAGRICEIE